MLSFWATASKRETSFGCSFFVVQSPAGVVISHRKAVSFTHNEHGGAIWHRVHNLTALGATRDF